MQNQRKLLIERSGLSFKADLQSFNESVLVEADKSGLMLLRGVPATILDKKNANGRIYSAEEMNRALDICRSRNLFEDKKLLCTGDDHPNSSYVKPIEATHIVTDAYVKTMNNVNYLLNDWLVLNTSKGKDLQALVNAGASIGTSIRGMGRFDENTNKIEEYEYLGTDAVGEPSAGTYGSSREFEVTTESSVQFEVVLESISKDDANKLIEKLGVEEMTYNLKSKISEFKEKYLKDDTKVDLTNNQLFSDFLTMQKEALEANVDIKDLSDLKDQIFGDSKNDNNKSNDLRTENDVTDLLNKANRRNQMTENLAAYTEDQKKSLEKVADDYKKYKEAAVKIIDGMKEEIKKLKTQKFDESKIKEIKESLGQEHQQALSEAIQKIQKESRDKAIKAIRKAKKESKNAILSLENDLDNTINLSELITDTAINQQKILQELYQYVKTLGDKENEKHIEHSRTTESIADDRYSASYA